MKVNAAEDGCGASGNSKCCQCVDDALGMIANDANARLSMSCVSEKAICYMYCNAGHVSCACALS